MNHILLDGRLGTEPEVKTFGENRLCTARFAHRRKDPKNKGEWLTDWYTLNAWNFSASALERMSKGDSLVIEGQIELKDYEAKDGTKRVDVSIRVNQSFGPKKWVEDEVGTAPKRGGSGGKSEDDLPF